MAQLDKDDLKQMNRSYFQSLSQETLVEVADNLHQLAIELWEKQQQNSENSSQPPSKDNPYVSSLSTTEELSPSSESESTEIKTEQKPIDESRGKGKKKKSQRKAGKQPGGKGFGRTQPLDLHSFHFSSGSTRSFSTTISCWQLINGHGDQLRWCAERNRCVPNFPGFFRGGNKRLRFNSLW